MNFQDYVLKQQSVIDNLSNPEIIAFLEGLHAIRSAGATLWIAGNGGSASTGSHAVVDFVKTAQSHSRSFLRAQNLPDAVALTTAFSNDISFESSLGNSLKSLAIPGDSLLILSVSGTSPNLIYAFEIAKEIGLKTFCILGKKGIDLAEKSDYSIVIESEDYQIVENVQLMLIHWFTKCLKENQ